MGLNKTSVGSDKYHQSFYKLKNPLKYVGDPTQIVCRSSWETKFCHYCDNNQAIMKWGSELVEVPYNDHLGKPHTYYTDFYLEIARPDLPTGLIRAVIEVKPKSETRPPEIPKEATLKALKRIEYQMLTWQKNFAKWTAAIEWCARRDMKFVLVTEEDLKQISTMLF
jgi:hypothetical protein